ncbi:MAG: Translation initiation factor 3 subunit J component [Peltula sp. TS41687]|nr:MAG: Translation initiation factor 3 subunit J component [Peltula sp. TS41687]
MAAAQSRWDDDDESTPPSSPPTTAAVHRRKFDDEEEDSDVVESWDAADDSEEEAEKAKQAAAAKAKADAEAAANKKSKAQRIAEHQAARKQAEETESDEETSSEEEDEAARRERLRKTEQDADLKHAEDLFGEVGISSQRSAAAPKSVVVVTQDPRNPEHAIDLSSLPIFKPATKAGFDGLRDILGPLLTANAKKAHYSGFLTEFAKQLAKDLPSGEIKKISSALATLSNEKMKEEKAAEKGGKKTKAAKTKASLVATRDASYKADTTSYDDGLDE